MFPIVIIWKFVAISAFLLKNLFGNCIAKVFQSLFVVSFKNPAFFPVNSAFDGSRYEKSPLMQRTNGEN